MLGLYQSSVRFMLAEAGMLGEDHPTKESSQLARVKHFCGTLSAYPKDVADSQAVMEALAEITPAFTVEQQREMAVAVSLHMHAKSANSGQQVQNSPHNSPCKQQVHMFLHEWLPDLCWGRYFDKSMSVDAKLEDFIDFCLRIGLRNPNDATLKTILAIIMICHQIEYTPSEAYNQIKSIRLKFAHKRQLRGGERLLDEYPRDPSDFMRLHPHVYPESSPPIASRLDALRIQDLTRKDRIPTRCSNNGVENKSRGHSSPGGEDDCTWKSLAVRFMLGQTPQVPALSNATPPSNKKHKADPLLALPAPPQAMPPAEAPRPLALANAAAQPALAADDQPGKLQMGVEDILAQAQQTLAQPPKGVKAKGKARRKQNLRLARRRPRRKTKQQRAR